MAVDEKALEEMVGAWGLCGPVSVTPAMSGTQNQTWRVESGDGTYFLRVYRNTTDARRVRYEHAILTALAARRLSFSVAAPIPMSGGKTVVSVRGELAAVFPALEGERVDRTNVAHARACGVALGELHAALAEIDPGAPPELARYGDLDRVHALVPDPWVLPRELSMDEAARARLTQILGRLRERAPGLYETLPQQLCHNDFSPGNLLMQGDTVSGVLDFEFAGPDLRALDVCTCWYWLALRFSSGRRALDAPTVRTFLDGYVTSEAPALTPEELGAMSDLVRLRGAVSLIHREGRRRAGFDSEQAVLDRVELLVALDDWLDANAVF